MKSNEKRSVTTLGILVLLFQGVLPPHALAGNKRAAVPQWRLQVANVESGDVNLDPAFRAAIYENLVDELAKKKQSKQVFRSGDRNAIGVHDLLILKQYRIIRRAVRRNELLQR
jgi:hypothetical protein